MLQRNMPHISEKTVKHIEKWCGGLADFFVIESGSDDDMLYSKESNRFHANWPDVRENGLRWARGFNYGILEAQKIQDYEFYMLMNGDVELFEENTVAVLLEQMDKHSKLGIVSANAPMWGQDVKGPLKGKDFISHWQITIDCWLVRKTFIDDVSKDFEETSYIQYLFDGTNFRGAFTDDEVLMRGYNKDWFSGYAANTSFIENDDVTGKNFEQMKTEALLPSRQKMTQEGLSWIKSKYNCTTKNQYRNLNLYTYISFFMRNPELSYLCCCPQLLENNLSSNQSRESTKDSDDHNFVRF
tara:strand:+ start:480 stop:1376 length:897 start_codon:yes stop_codon:yes gene_type:complete